MDYANTALVVILVSWGLTLFNLTHISGRSTLSFTLSLLQDGICREGIDENIFQASAPNMDT